MDAIVPPNDPSLSYHPVILPSCRAHSKPATGQVDFHITPTSPLMLSKDPFSAQVLTVGAPQPSSINITWQRAGRAYSQTPLQTDWIRNSGTGWTQDYVSTSLQVIWMMVMLEMCWWNPFFFFFFALKILYMNCFVPTLIIEQLILYPVPTEDTKMMLLLSKNSQREIEIKINYDNTVM